MRVYGRTQDVLTGKKTWQMVTTDVNGYNDSVYLTNLAQVLKLNLGESPFYGNWGIPAHQSVMMQLAPDFYMALTQQRFADKFTSLILVRVPNTVDDDGRPAPSYQINALTHYGAIIGVNVRPQLAATGGPYPPQQPI
jgi:hypothetical protein